MENVIVVKHSSHCVWDEFTCENAEEAKFVLDLLQNEYPRTTTKMSVAVTNMVKHDRIIGRSDLFEFLKSNGIKIER